MATGIEIINQYLLMYNAGINDLKLFDKDFPDSKDEYNYWRSVLIKMRNTMLNLGMSNLEDIPPKK
jgi:hypothetical protein